MAMAAARGRTLHRLGRQMVKSTWMLNGAPSTSTRRMSTSPNEEAIHCDVLIAGGGLVGAGLACGIANNALLRGLRVLLVEGKPLLSLTPSSLTPSSEPPDARVVALNPSSVRFLTEAGVWDEIKKRRCAPFDTMQVWDYAGPGYVRYNSRDVGFSELGYVVENDILVAALHERLQNELSSRVTCIAPAAVSSIVWGEGGGRPLIGLDNGSHICTRLVVGADGGRSKVRDLAEITSVRRSYRQRAVVATVEVERPHSTAWQRFLPSGPLALLPCGDRYSNIVWSTTETHAKELQDMADDAFVQEVNSSLVESYAPLPSSNPNFLSSFGNFFPSSLSPSTTEAFHVPPRAVACYGRRSSFPLNLAHASTYVASRLALIGDAAHSVHPLAGQGANLGMADAGALLDILENGASLGSDVGDAALLGEYEARRRRANLAMVAGLDALHRVFAVQFSPFAFARNVGLAAVHRSGPLKRRAMALAMGEEF